MNSILCRISHVISGFITALSSIVNAVLPIIGFLVFFTYEADEYKVLGDDLFEEMLEYGIGFFIGTTILILIKLFITGWPT